VTELQAVRHGSPSANAAPRPGLPNVHQAMAEAMRRTRPVGKWGRNSDQGYAFRSIDHFMTSLSPAMAEAGIHIAPRVITRDKRIEDRFDRSNPPKKVGRWVYVDLEVEFTFYGPAGDSFTVTCWGEGSDTSDKSTNKAMTGAFKYAIMQAFMVPTADLQDSDRHGPDGGPENSQQAPEPPSPQLVTRYRNDAVGATRDASTLDELRSKLAAIWRDAAAHNALAQEVTIPSGWRSEGDPESCPLGDLLQGAAKFRGQNPDAPVEALDASPAASDDSQAPTPPPEPGEGVHDDSAAATLPCGCSTDEVFNTNKHREGCPEHRTTETLCPVTNTTGKLCSRQAQHEGVRHLFTRDPEEGK
jgi:hypothetical protein